MRYQVNLLTRAAADYRQMFLYIEERSPQGAINWEKAFEAGLERLAANPLACGLAPEDKHFAFELRQLLFKTRHGLTYRAVFRVVSQEVSILRLCGPGQPPLTPDEVALR